MAPLVFVDKYPNLFGWDPGFQAFTLNSDHRIVTFTSFLLLFDGSGV
jgi:hypothetical protein